MKFVAPWSSIHCPACCHRFHLSQAGRRLQSPSAPTEPDDKLGRFLGMPAPPLAKVEPPLKGGILGRMYRRIVIHDDGRQGWKKVCPECHFPLPHKTAIGEVNSEFFAIIGARSSGKSNYFGVLLKLLERRYASEVGFTIFDQESLDIATLKTVGSSQLYRRRYGDRLWNSDDRMAIDQTVSLTQNAEYRIPLIYRIESPKRLWQYFTKPLARVNAVHTVIFDAAGEDMNDADRLDQHYRYLAGAAGIIFLIDPFQYPGIREHLSPELRKRFPVQVEPTEIVSQVINLLERQTGRKAGQKINVPVAFVFTKCDMFRNTDIVDKSSPILRDATHKRGFNSADCEMVSKEVRQLIKDGESQYLLKLSEAFSHSAFFAVSALGETPDERLRLRSIQPLRVADPLLWMLWQRGYIPEAKPK